MKESFNNAIKDPLIRRLLKIAAVLVAVVLAAIGIKMLKDRFRK
jgi:hypothetical protein